MNEQEELAYKCGFEKRKFRNNSLGIEEECLWPKNAVEGPIRIANDVKTGPGKNAPVYAPMEVFTEVTHCRYCHKPIYRGGTTLPSQITNCTCHARSGENPWPGL